MHLGKLAFAAHVAIETIPGISFIARPEAHLPGCTPAAALILRQYGGLLLASSFVCLTVIADSGLSTTTTQLLAASLGSYHAWPFYRALARIRSQGKQSSELGGPWVHFLVHGVCLGLFVHAAVAGT
ncbi:hypothetical protein NUW58_g2589 [Xylaria curta]|uniref:Uncharacterized protein n=1 Tax=Xylaria curta TaxID=42375 RepID=A0ACC1PET6_9PEZI|nr:hypothetical protein NUW58_g2589 [Xylaria curta]